MLGHKDLSRTSTCLNATFPGLQESMRKFDEAGAVCKAIAKKPAVERAPFATGRLRSIRKCW